MNEKKIDNLLYSIAEENHLDLLQFSALSGGDINDVFLLEMDSQEKKVLKLNSANKFPGMFKAEKEGLKALQKCNAIDIPKVIATGISGSYSYLLLEYIESKEKTADFWKIFGKQLAKLHQCTSERFGFYDDNYIGSLPQHNAWCDSASEFYINRRLEPQLKIAKDKGYKLHVKASFFKTISEIIPKEPPSLLHGDLWNGNYLLNSKGFPCLIDPAVSFGPREMDLAMMQLFGGFNQEIFNFYEQEYKLADGFEERVPMWQLYYLLVHLNIFGKSYRNSVIKIIDCYS